MNSTYTHNSFNFCFNIIQHYIIFSEYDNNFFFFNLKKYVLPCMDIVLFLMTKMKEQIVFKYETYAILNFWQKTNFNTFISSWRN